MAAAAGATLALSGPSGLESRLIGVPRPFRHRFRCRVNDDLPQLAVQQIADSPGNDEMHETGATSQCGFCCQGGRSGISTATGDQQQGAALILVRRRIDMRQPVLGGAFVHPFPWSGNRLHDRFRETDIDNPQLTGSGSTRMEDEPELGQANGDRAICPAGRAVHLPGGSIDA